MKKRILLHRIESRNTHIALRRGLSDQNHTMHKGSHPGRQRGNPNEGNQNLF